jgi:DNA-binding GntR family transcriptional regulator
MELTKLPRSRATDDVYDSLRQAILSHAFRPGDRLPITEIANKLGVSLTPVRHAIQKLASEGLIEVHPRSGTYVATLDVQDIEETFDIRSALECLAAEQAVERVTDSDLDHLHELLRGLAEETADEAGLRRHEQLNSKLHATIVRVSGNRRLQEIHESLKANIQIARVHVVEGYRGDRFDVEQEEHAEIVAALEKRNAEWLQKALRQHIQRAKQSLIKSLQEIAKPHA